MNTCPSCGYQPLPADARYCPNCSRPLDLARIRIDQNVAQNAGSVIGVRTETVNGNIYGGDIYQVQIYALSAEGRSGFGQRLLDENASPYKYLAPYGPLDAPLFKGRSQEIDEILLDLGAWRLLVLYGPPGVGKTSLLAAGVLPRILESGALAIHIRDYTQPLASTLRMALNASREKLTLDLPGAGQPPSLADLLASVTSQTGGTLVLLLDQFERLFRPPIPPDLAAAQVNALIESLGKVEAQYLRVILSVRDDALVRLADLQRSLPDMFRAFRPVKPLTRQQARQAVLEPLEEVRQASARIYYEEGFVDQVLLPDLDLLTPEEPDTVRPPHLQIVCHWLYRAAVGLENPQVTRQLYRGTLKGAQGILHGYLQETLAGLGEGRLLAERALVAMATPGAPEWVSPAGLQIEGAGPETVGPVLERLAASELLVQRQSQDGLLYAFAGQPVLDEVTLLAGDEIGQRVLAGRELGRAWAAWAAHRDLATPLQMRRLAAFGGHLAPSPLESLLLIRSAQAANQPAAPWLASLSTGQGRSLVRQLEALPPEGAPWYFSESELAEARLLLGVEVISNLPNVVRAQSEISNQADASYGPLALASAARQADPASRQAAAVALLAAGRRTALDRLGWALQDCLTGLRRALRRAELRGALAEADPPVAALNAALPAGDRALTWGWRASRRTLAALDSIAVITLGASAGAGLGLGLLRFITALLTGNTPGLFFILNTFFGALLGGSVTLGYLLAGPLLLQSSGPPPASSPRSPWPRLALAVLLGGLFFGLAQMVVVLTTGRLSLSGKEAVFGLGLVAGLGWCLALSLPPGKYFWERPALWPLRAAAVALIFALLQALFLYRIDYRSSLVFLLTGMDYERNFLAPAGLPWVAALPGWFNLLAMLDAVLSAGVLTLGGALGARLAARFYQAVFGQAVIGQPWRR